MKKINIFDKQNNLRFSVKLEENEIDAWVNSVESKGKPERWVRAKVPSPITDAFDFIYPDGYYDDADVIESRVDESKEKIKVVKKFKEEEIREIPDGDGDDSNNKTETVITERTEEKEEDVVVSSVTWVKLRADYTIEIIDITEQLEKEKRIAELRKLLSDSDWTQMPDVLEDKGAQYVNSWKVKRKAWRDEISSLTEGT